MKAKLQQKIERVNAIEKFKKQFISGAGAAPRLSRRSRRRFCKLPIVEKRQTPSTTCSTSIATASLLSARRLSSSASFAKILEQKGLKKSSSSSTIAISNLPQEPRAPPPSLPEPNISLSHSARAKINANGVGTVVISTVSDKSEDVPECANMPPAEAISEDFLCESKNTEDLKAEKIQNMIDLQLEPLQASLSMIVQAVKQHPPLEEIRDESILPEIPVEAAILDQAMQPVVFSWQESQDIRGHEFLEDEADAADPNPYTSLFAESQDISRPCLFEKDDDFEYEPQIPKVADEEPGKTADEKTFESPFYRDLLLQPVTVPISDVHVKDEERQAPANPTLLVSRTKQNQSRAIGARRLSDLFSVATTDALDKQDTTDLQNISAFLEDDLDLFSIGGNLLADLEFD